MKERDQCGPNFHYRVVVKANPTSSTTHVSETSADNESWINVDVVHANSTTVDIDVSNLPSFNENKTVQLSVIAVNSEGAAPLPQTVTSLSDPSTSHPVSCKCINEQQQIVFLL